MMNLISDIGNVLDTPGSILRAGLAGRNPLTGIFDPEHRVSGRDLLERWGLLGKNRPGLDAGDVLGTAAEMLFDPTNALGLGIANKLLKSAAKIKAANAVSKRLRQMGAMPEEVAKLTKIVDESGKPLRTYHGTPHAYDKVDAATFSPDSLYGPGHYTTVDPTVASEYTAKDAAKATNVSRKPEVTDELLADLAEQHFPDQFYSGWRERTFGKKYASKEAAKEIDSRMKSMLPEPEGWAIEQAEHRDKFLKKYAPLVGQYDVLPPPMNVRMQYTDARNPFDVFRESIPKSEADEMLRAMGMDGMETRGAAMPGGHIEDILTPSGVRSLRQHGYDAVVHTGGRNTGGAPHKVVIAFDPSQIYAPYIAPALQHERRLIPTLSPVAAALFGHNVLARSHSNYGPTDAY